MTEPVLDPAPDYRNRFAHLVGLIFHPFVVPIPTLLLLLRPLPRPEAHGWTALILVILITPVGLTLLLLARRGKYVYQRDVRGPLYVLGWTSVLTCLLLTLVLNAPRMLVACMATLAVWLPLQSAINQRFTKVSIHVAVITGCLLGLLLTGALESLWVRIAAVLAIYLTAWARMVTRNHTLAQVGLGILLGAIPVLLVFPLLLR